MSYVNQFELIQVMMEQKPLDHKELLAGVDRNKVIRALERSKDGFPPPVRFTNEPVEEKRFAAMPDRGKERVRAVQRALQKTPAGTIPELLELRRLYPNVPVIYNCLTIAYVLTGQEELHFKALVETTKRFPDYLFGKTALAEYYIYRDEHRKVKEVFDGKLGIWQHYPDVKVFHMSEVRSFFGVVGVCFARVGNVSRALYHYFTLVDVEPDHQVTTRLGVEIVLAEIEKIRRKVARNTGRKRRPRR